jgi:PQQ-like domain
VAEPAVIELGADLGTVEWVRRPPPVWWRRSWALAGYAALVLLLLGPPRPARPVALLPVAAIPAGGSITRAVAGDTLFTAWFARQAPSLGNAPVPIRAALDAYRLSDGQLRWRVLLPVNSGNLLIRAAGTQTVVVSSLDPGATGDRTVAYDADSGRLLWDSRLPLVPTVAVGAVAVLAAYLDPDGAPASSPFAHSGSAGAAPAVVLQGVSARTGTVQWALRVPAGSVTVLPGPGEAAPAGHPYAVIVAPGGDARSVDLYSGGRSPPARIPVAGGAGGNPLTLAVTGGWLLAGEQRAGRSTLTGYRVQTLAPAWRVPVPSPGLEAVACGELICLTGRQGTSALDPATGRMRWTSTRWRPAGMLGGWVYALPGDGQPGTGSLLSPGTGAPVLDLAGWAPLPGPGGGPDLVYTTPAGSQAPTGSRSAWLGVLRATPQGPRVDRLGPLVDPAVGGCESVPEYVVCGTAAGRLLVWRYRA